MDIKGFIQPVLITLGTGLLIFRIIKHEISGVQADLQTNAILTNPHIDEIDDKPSNDPKKSSEETFEVSFPVPIQTLVHLIDNTNNLMENICLPLILRSFIINKKSVHLVLDDLLSNNENKFLKAATTLYGPIAAIKKGGISKNLSLCICNMFWRPLLIKLRTFSLSRPTSIDSESIFSFLVAVEEVVIIISYIEDKTSEFDDLEELSKELYDFLQKITTNFSGIGPGIDLADQVAVLRTLHKNIMHKQIGL